MLLTKKYSVRPRLNAVKCHTMTDYLETGLFIPTYINAIGKIIPVEMARVWFLTFNIREGHGKTMTSHYIH